MIEQPMKPTGHGLTRIQRPLSMAIGKQSIHNINVDGWRAHETIKYGILLDMLLMAVSW